MVEWVSGASWPWTEVYRRDPSGARYKWFLAVDSATVMFGVK